MVRVHLICDDEALGGALSAALSASPEVEEASIGPIDDLMSGSNVSDVSRVVVIQRDGAATSELTELAIEAPVLVLGSGDSAEMAEAVEAGAMGYLVANAPLDAVVDAVRSLAKGTAVVDPSLLGALLRHVVDRRRAEREALTELDVLTPREDEVFRLLAKGMGNHEVGERLFISPQTVRTHTRSIMTKLDLHSRSDLVALAARCGLDLGADP